MFRTAKSVAAAVVTAAAAVLAIPGGSASAVSAYPQAIVSLTSKGPQVYSATCQKGEDFTLWGDSSIDNGGNGLLYFWFSDQDSQDSYSASYTFPCDFYGTNHVTFRATTIGEPDEYWEHDTQDVYVDSNAAPTAEISLNGKPVGGFLEVPVPSSVTFSAATSVDPEGGPLTYVWTTSGGQQVAGETFTATCGDFPSRYSVDLAVTDNVGFVGKSQVIVDCVLAPPTAGFTPEPLPGGARKLVPLGTKITFKPTAPNDGNSFAWRTTGVSGVASTGYEFTRTFDAVGNYGVQLTESNLSGSASLWSGFTVIGPPKASVTPAPANEKERKKVPVGTKITFDGSGSQSPGGGSLTYQWRTTGARGVVADGRSYTRTFDTAGLIGVELTVVNDLGQSAKRWVGFDVVPAADPVASLTSTPAGSPDATKRTPVKVGTTITFDGRASVDPDGGSLTYQWRTTGVGGLAAVTDTYTRKFDKVGDFGVELTVIDDEGRIARRWVGFTVQP